MYFHEAYAQVGCRDLGAIKLIEACYEPKASIVACLTDPATWKANGYKCLLGNFEEMEVLEIFQKPDNIISVPNPNNHPEFNSPFTQYPKIVVKFHSATGNTKPAIVVLCQAVSSISGANGLMHQLEFSFIAKNVSVGGVYSLNPSTYNITEQNKVNCANQLVAKLEADGNNLPVCIYASALPSLTCDGGSDSDGNDTRSFQTRIRETFSKAPSAKAQQKFNALSIKTSNGVTLP